MLPSKLRKLAGIVVDERRNVTAENIPDGAKAKKTAEGRRNPPLSGSATTGIARIERCVHRRGL